MTGDPIYFVTFRNPRKFGKYDFELLQIAGGLPEKTRRVARHQGARFAADRILAECLGSAVRTH